MPWMDRNLGIVLGARGAMSAARAIAGIVTAIYLSAEGFSALRIGMLFLCVSLASAVMSSFIGLGADARGRKLFLVVVPLLASASALVFAFERETVLLFIFASLGSFGRGAGAGSGSVGPYQPAEAAFVADTATEERRTDAFGRLFFLSSLGALAGGLLAGLAQPGKATGAAAMVAYRPAFLAAAALSALAGILALGLSEPTRRQAAGGRRPRLVLPRRSWEVLWRFWITNGLNGMAIGMFGPFISYWFHRRYGSSPGEIGILFAVVNVATLASSLSAASLGRRFGTVRAIVGVRFIQGVLLVPMALAPSFYAAGAIYLVRMLVQRLGVPLRQSFALSVADPAERASLIALSNLPSQGSQAISQVFAGYLFDEISLAAPLLIGGLLQALNAGAYGVLFLAKDPGRTRPAMSEEGDAQATPASVCTAHGERSLDGEVPQAGGDVVGEQAYG
ncbi:MAG: MFS transporter, partial [Acidimicrobiales bacterium]